MLSLIFIRTDLEKVGGVYPYPPLLIDNAKYFSFSKKMLTIFCMLLPPDKVDNACN